MAKGDKVETEVAVDVEAEIANAEGLIAVVKDDVRLFVHETCLKAHELIGWVLSKV